MVWDLFSRNMYTYCIREKTYTLILLKSVKKATALAPAKLMKVN